VGDDFGDDFGDVFGEGDAWATPPDDAGRVFR
jgi:hypothetical protein